MSKSGEFEGVYYKYPRTFHLPWSESKTDDDKTHADDQFLQNKIVVATEKLDGENTSLYSKYLHARSLDSPAHLSQDWIRRFHAQLAYNIPEGWRICGENVYAKHAILYKNLTSYFYGFSVWDDHNRCLSWNETKDWLVLLGIQCVPELYYGIYDRKLIHRAWKTLDRDSEGYVIRVADAFHFNSFSALVGKFVRENHVSTGVLHWKYTKLIKNQLA